MKCFCDAERVISTDGYFLYHHCDHCGFEGVEYIGIYPRVVYFDTQPECSEGQFFVDEILYVGIKTMEIDLSYLDDLFEKA